MNKIKSKMATIFTTFLLLLKLYVNKTSRGYLKYDWVLPSFCCGPCFKRSADFFQPNKKHCCKRPLLKIQQEYYYNIKNIIS